MLRQPRVFRSAICRLGLRRSLLTPSATVFSSAAAGSIPNAIKTPSPGFKINPASFLDDGPSRVVSESPPVDLEAAAAAARAAFLGSYCTVDRSFAAPTAQVSPGNEGGFHFLEDALRVAETFGSRPAYIDAETNDIITFRSLVLRVRRLIDILPQRFSTRPGDRAFVYSVGSVFLPEVILAALAVGVVVFPTSAMISVENAAAAIHNSAPRLFFCTKGFETFARDLMDASGGTQKLIHYIDTPRHEKLLTDASLYRAYTPDEATADDLALVPPTAGASGPHKLTKFTFGALERTTRAFVDAYAGDALGPDHVSAMVFPMTYMVGMQVHCLASLLTGTTTVTSPRRFDFQALLSAVHTHRVTSIFAPPTVWHDMVEHPAAAAFDTSSVRRVVLTGSPIAPAVERRLAAARPDVKLTQAVMMTELGGIASVRRPFDRAGSVGALLGGVEMRVVDPATKRTLSAAELIGVDSHSDVLSVLDAAERTAAASKSAPEGAATAASRRAADAAASGKRARAIDFARSDVQLVSAAAAELGLESDAAPAADPLVDADADAVGEEVAPPSAGAAASQSESSAPAPTPNAGRGAVGELHLRGLGMFEGYWRNAPANQAAWMDDEWFATGDLVSVDATGSVTFHDRVADLMYLIDDTPVAPAAVERVLLAHPLVADCIVVGFPDESDVMSEKQQALAPTARRVRRSKPRAYVEFHPGVPASVAPTPAELEEFVRKTAPAHLHVSGGVVVLDKVPRSRAGKPLRDRLRLACMNEARKNAQKTLMRMGHQRYIETGYDPLIPGGGAQVALPATAKGYTTEEAEEAVRRELMRRHASHRAAGVDPDRRPNEMRSDAEILGAKGVDERTDHLGRARDKTDPRTRRSATKPGDKFADEAVWTPSPSEREDVRDLEEWAAKRDEERALRRAAALDAARERIMKRDYKFSVERNTHLEQLDKKRRALRDLDQNLGSSKGSNRF